MEALRKLHQDEAGQGMTEYILIVVFIAIAVLIVLGLFRDNIKKLFRGTNSELQNVDVSPSP
jgi:Flp pilus assembly pilin Flp